LLVVCIGNGQGYGTFYDILYLQYRFKTALHNNVILGSSDWALEVYTFRSTSLVVPHVSIRNESCTHESSFQMLINVPKLYGFNITLSCDGASACLRCFSDQGMFTEYMIEEMDSQRYCYCNFQFWMLLRILNLLLYVSFFR